MENVSNSGAASLQEQLEMLDFYLSDNYEFRHNVLANKYEVRERAKEGAAFRPLTREALNTIMRRIKCEGLEVKNLKQNVEEFIYSEDTHAYDPIREFLDQLPQWDGENHIGHLFGRIPGVTTEQQYLLSIWMRSAVAHWLGMDTLHGNECVVTLIGCQGCGKSTFCARLLPPELREYYLDHLHLANKNDKEMALTNNLLVNLDELDQFKPRQHAELKQTLSKVVVNGRPIYGREQHCRQRYASFVSTTNNEHPLTDRTGSRRYLCIRIPKGALVNNDTDIDYGQLYAQVMYELKQDMRYWFTNEEVKRIEELNLPYGAVRDLESMLDYCFRAPEEGEEANLVLTKDIVKHIALEFPTVEINQSTTVKVGRILRQREQKSKTLNKGIAYYLVPRNCEVLAS